eukprot:CAMPEP_0119482960 /NCGR_PEP_ID=MMETSP1344-20130328/10581_1 /TAXON_ID=236787 /ORGANISM="Florenciella parvula, Strain CCMP2471" /LENGTH=385 /DNA_ID=CAMNT_0007517415 /DNA_START=207 /DNA_END=1364 /DNA_ORIENTATION=-
MSNKKMLLPRPAPMLNMGMPGMLPIMPLGGMPSVPMMMPGMQPFPMGMGIPMPMTMPMPMPMPMGAPFIVPRPAGMKARSNSEAGATASSTQTKKRPRLSDEERLERSRERNRIHARKTRQRKKAMLTSLQETVKELTEKGTKLRQTINERKTASILLMMAVPDMDIPDLPVPIEFNACEVSDCDENEEADEVDGKTEKEEELEDEDEDDTCKGAELLLISRHGNAKRQMGDLDLVSGPDSKRQKASPSANANADGAVKEEEPSAEELELVRRERNRMHAKRTRIRKKMLVDQTYKVIQRLEAQNKLLGEYVGKLEGSSAKVASPALPSKSSAGDAGTGMKPAVEDDLAVPALPQSGLKTFAAAVPCVLDGTTLRNVGFPLGNLA